VDRLTPALRSALMRRVRQRDTTPEIVAKQALRVAGIRFKSNARDLAGRPDIVIPAWHMCIFVHGCYWHRHLGCKRTTTPSTRRAFWLEKFEANMRRDRRVSYALRRQGWKVYVLWECKTTNAVQLARQIATWRRRFDEKPFNRSGEPAQRSFVNRA
jgi:DNA mismatch endonuclease (patch repair protein)